MRWTSDLCIIKVGVQKQEVADTWNTAKDSEPSLDVSWKDWLK